VTRLAASRLQRMDPKLHGAGSDEIIAGIAVGLLFVQACNVLLLTKGNGRSGSSFLSSTARRGPGRTRGSRRARGRNRIRNGVVEPGVVWRLPRGRQLTPPAVMLRTYRLQQGAERSQGWG
jgi:hypothetical protein